MNAFKNAMKQLDSSAKAASLYLEVAEKTSKELLPEEYGVIVAPLRVRI